MARLLFLLLLFSCTVTPIQKAPTLQPIIDVAEQSECAKYSFKNRGKAPKAFISGMALSFAHDICSPQPGLSGPIGGEKDIFNHYASIFDQAKLGKATESERRLAVFTLLIGLGMRESSGKHCCGRDQSASNLEASTVEAGAFQASYNSTNFSKELKAMLEAPKACLLDVFSQGVTCGANDLKNYGTGPGLKFQEQMKNCPRLAASYTGTLLRLSGGALSHFGPIRRKEAEVVPACAEMLYKVQQIVAFENVCGAFK